MGISIVTMAGMNMSYEAAHGTDIFDGIVIPSELDRSTLIDRIMIRCMEFSVGHTDPEFMHEQILNFFKVHARTFEKWVELEKVKYNPLDNYDRHEEYKGSGSHENENENSGTSHNEDILTDTSKRTAFNSTSFEPYERIDRTEINDGSSSLNGSDNGTYADEHEIYTHGNIGVMSSQDLYRQEWETVQLNIYKTIADLFCDEFCIMVY